MRMVNFLQRNYVCSSRSKIPFKIRLNRSTGSALLNEGGGSYFVPVMSGTHLFPILYPGLSFSISTVKYLMGIFVRFSESFSI